MELQQESLSKKRREDFSIDTLRYLEAGIGVLRVSIMRLAAQHAEKRQSEQDIFQVEPEDIDATIKEAYQECMAEKTDE